MKRLCILAVGILSTLLTTSTAHAFDWAVTAKVTQIEASYMPDKVYFQINAPAGACAAGSQLLWVSRSSNATTAIHNVEAVYALLLSAKISGQNVLLHGNNANCLLDYVYAAQ